MKKVLQKAVKNNFFKLMKMTLAQLSFAVLLTNFVFGGSPKAQDILNKSVSIKLENAELRDALVQLERAADVKFVYSSRAIQANRKVSISANNKKLSDILDGALKPLKIGYKVIGGQIILNADIKKSEVPPLSTGDATNRLSLKTSLAQTVSGVVKDAKGEAIPGISIIIKGTTKGVQTDAEGKFSIDAEVGNVLVFTSVGFIKQEITVTKDMSTLNIVLVEDLATLGEVTVVGSRGKGRTDVDRPVPVDVISPKDLKGFSQVDVGQILNYVAPSFNSNRQTVADGTDHVDPASLRGLGPDQVLVLVNGKRRHTSALVNINGTVGRGAVGTDMNVIPVAAIERIEVLRDGAAAQYGSDAIAGVINVVLKKDFSGFAASLTTGANVTDLKYTAPIIGGATKSYSEKMTDGQVLQFDLMKGFRLGTEGYLTLAAQYNDRGKTNRSGIDNIPTTYLGNNGGFPGTPAGQDATVFRTGLIAADAAIEKTNGYNRHNMVFGNSTSRNIGLFFNGGIPTNANSEFYFSGGITYRTGQGYGNYRVPVARNQQPLKVDGSLWYPNGFLPGIQSDINDQSAILGYKTKFGDWKMDLSNTFGANSFQFTVFNSGNASLSNSDSQPTKFDAGKLKFNQNTTNLDFSRAFDKAGAIEGLNMAFGAEFRRDQYQIVAGEKNSYFGDGRTVPTAPLTAGGAAQGTAVAAPGAQVFPGYQISNEINKSRTNLGIYADFEGELAKRILLGIAGRFENYSDFGTNFSGKASTRIKITDNIALRGSVSTGFRAPSLHQKYFNNTSTQFVSGLPSNTLTVNNDDPIARTKIGVDELRPETSVNFAAGITAKVNTALTLTIDAYQIDIKDRIVYSGAFSRAILGFTASEYIGVNNVNFFANAANTKTQGIDIVAHSKFAIGKGQLNLTAALNFNKNEVTSINSTALINDPAKNLTTDNPDNWFKNKLFDRQQRSRIEVWQPKNKVNISASYSIGKFDITARTVRFGEVQYVHNLDTKEKKADGTYWNSIFSRDASGNAYIEQTFKPVFITDLILNYRATEKFSVAIGANNILDVYPDQIYIDPRNAYGSVDYAAGRDASNRGRLLYQPNQGGYNGRFLFARLVYAMK
jgi:iron complex outermembrane recepter protein